MNDRIKGMTVLDLTYEGKGQVEFGRTVEPGPGEAFTSVEPPALTVDHDAWEDMGRPSQITVTVQPGDLLNEVRAASNG